MKTVKKALKKKKDSLVKIVAPKIVTALANITRMGPRMIFRSTMELLRANLITRILSCLSLLIIDMADLFRKRISVAQFVKNVILSALLVISGTLGWNFGSRWIVLEIFGGFVDIIGGIIGAGIMSFLSNVVLDKISGRIVESDAQKMWKILDPYIDALPEAEREYARERVTSACLKKMYAAKNKQTYAAELVRKIQAHEKVDGHIRAEYHKH